MILAIDPATRCGWAWTDGQDLQSGFWELSKAPRSGKRYAEFWSILNALDKDVKLCFYEDVRRHMSTDSAHAYGGFVAVLLMWCYERGIKAHGLPVKTIKKFATDTGQSDKDGMVQAARRQWPHFLSGDDNEADALWILATGVHLKNEGVKLK